MSLPLLLFFTVTNTVNDNQRYQYVGDTAPGAITTSLYSPRITPTVDQVE